MTSATYTSHIQPSSRVLRSEAIDFAEIGDSIVMMDVDEGRYYELDPVGAKVWALIEPGPRVAEVYAALVAEYEVIPETCYGETRAFLDELSRLAVVEIRRSDEEVERKINADGGAVATAGKSERPDGTSGPRTTPSAKCAWTAPTVQVMSVNHTKSGRLYVPDSIEIHQYRPPPS